MAADGAGALIADCSQFVALRCFCGTRTGLSCDRTLSEGCDLLPGSGGNSRWVVPLSEECIIASGRTFLIWSTLAGRRKFAVGLSGGSFVSKDALHDRALRCGPALRIV
jgi:hypothetical protein